MNVMVHQNCRVFGQEVAVAQTLATSQPYASFKGTGHDRYGSPADPWCDSISGDQPTGLTSTSSDMASYQNEQGNVSHCLRMHDEFIRTEGQYALIPG